MNDHGDTLAKVVRTVALTFSEESLAVRYERIKGFNAINQIERLYVTSAPGINFTEHKRLHFSGSNRGNHLGPMSAPSWEDDEQTWTTSVKQKKEIYGKNARIAVGGQTDGITEKAPKRADTSTEPVFSMLGQ